MTGIVLLLLDLGDSSDTANLSAAFNPTTVYGGAGTDSILTSDFTGVATYMAGGPDDDIIISGLGKDTIDGGPGADTVVYRGLVGIHVSLPDHHGGRGNEMTVTSAAKTSSAARVTPSSSATTGQTSSTATATTTRSSATAGMTSSTVTSRAPGSTYTAAPTTTSSWAG